MVGIITYWEMCTGWNLLIIYSIDTPIITYWEMCTGWNSYSMSINWFAL